MSTFAERQSYTPIEVAIALSLYFFNVGATERAHQIYRHFDGNCMEMVELRDILENRAANTATELPYPSAVVYVDQALERYGAEAAERARVNRECG